MPAARRAIPASITGKTRVVGIIGDPVAHSRSPAMHNAAFAALGLDYVYVPFPVAGDNVGQAVDAIRALNLVGVNVTVPHKQAVIPFLDGISDAARACSAVNTIVHRNGRLFGDNTDAPGFARDLEPLGIPAKKRLSQVVVLGAGGSARAVVFALGQRSGRITIAARRPKQAVQLIRELAGHVRAELVTADLAELAPTSPDAKELLGRANLVVNTTSLGLKSESFVPLAYERTKSTCAWYDLIYTAPRTPFLAPAAHLGRPTRNGLGMLLHQGALAFRLWTGAEPPLEVMQRALRKKST